MNTYQWRPEYSVGNDELDKQHRSILALVAEINTLDEKDEYFLPAIHLLIFRLRDYIKSHFSTEEEMCRLIGFPETDEHIEQHRQFVRQLDVIERQALRGELALAEFQQFLNAWWQEHVLDSDRAMKPYFQRTQDSRQPASQSESA